MPQNSINSIFFFWILSIIACLGDSNPIDDIVLDIQGNGQVDYRSLNQDQRSQVVNKLKNNLKNHNYNYEESYLITGLINLNDHATITSLVNKYHAGDKESLSIIKSSQNPALVSYLGPDLLRQEDVLRPPEGDIIRGTIRGESANIITLLLRWCPEFTPATRAWIQSRSGNPDRDCILLALWWKHNRQALQDGRYQDATWLPSDVDLQTALKDPSFIKQMPVQGNLNNFDQTGSETPKSPVSALSSQYIIFTIIALTVLAITLGYLVNSRKRIQKNNQ